MILTGEHMLAEEAFRCGLVAKVHPVDKLVEEAVKCGNKMASFSRVISTSAKDSVNMAYDLPMSTGLDYEKRIFWGTFGTKDQKEGMGAFVEKRKPTWYNC